MYVEGPCGVWWRVEALHKYACGSAAQICGYVLHKYAGMCCTITWGWLIWSFKKGLNDLNKAKFANYLITFGEWPRRAVSLAISPSSRSLSLNSCTVYSI